MLSSRTKVKPPQAVSATATVAGIATVAFNAAKPCGWPVAYYDLYRDDSLLRTSLAAGVVNNVVGVPGSSHVYSAEAVNIHGVRSVRVAAPSITIPEGQGDLLIDVGFDSPPTVLGNGGIYTGAAGFLVIEARNGTSTKFEHITGSEAWGGSGGCAKFYGSTDGGGCYRGLNLGSLSGITTQMNMRYLNKWNSAFTGATGFKCDYMTIGGQPFWSQCGAPAIAFGGFQHSQSYDNTLYRIHGNGQSCLNITNAGYQGAGCDADSSIGPDVPGPFEYADYLDEWVCFEHELHSDGTFRTYIWTQDGEFSGLYLEARNMPQTGAIGVTGCGGMYFHDAGASYSGAALYIDEFSMGTSLIGPPAGF